MAEKVTDDTPIEELLALKEYLTPIEPDDPMPEAARKVLLADFIQMLEHEAGSRTGEDIEDVHKMRVATRRMRSTLREMDEYFQPKRLKKFQAGLKELASTLGDVRDLDVMINNLETYQAELDKDTAQGLQEFLNSLVKQQAKARENLVELLDSKSFQKFLDRQEKSLTTIQQDKTTPEDDIVPFQVRHVLPVMIQNCLSQIKAYDVIVDEASYEQLHALRIEFKRLRYILSGFQTILGSSAEKFITELKQIQDHLGELNDAMVAVWSLRPIMKKLSKDDPARDALKAYIKHNKTKAEQLMTEFPAVWDRFNTRTVQRALSDALLVVR